MTYAPSPRTVRIRALTPRGWVDGALRLPHAARLADWIEHAPAFLVLTDVRFEGHETVLPFVSLRRDAIRVLTADPEDGERASTTPASPHVLHGLLDVATVRGTVGLLPSVRLSDALAHRDGFLELHDVRVRAGPAGAPEVALHRAVVATRHLIAVTEPQGAEPQLPGR